MKEVDQSFKIFEEILKLKKYSSKEEVMDVAKSMLKLALSKPNLSEELKKAYKSAVSKLESLTYKEICEIIEILKIYN